jgi:hypothetical protein
MKPMERISNSRRSKLRHPSRTASRRWGKRLVLPALCLLALFLAGCEVDQQALQRDPFMRDMMQLQQQNNPTYQMDKPFEIGNTRWNIQAAHASLNLRLGQNVVLKAQGKFVIIDFVFTNLTTQVQHPTPDMLQVVDAQSHTYTADLHTTQMLSAWQHTANFLSDSFQPNQAITCSIVFDIPLEAQNLSLNFQSFPTEDDTTPI